MRLISCHIENFGKLSDETFDFKNSLGINIICRDNGWGKSTFAAFIKVMFFGFDNDGKRSEIENERRHYKPWQGGVYGGQVTFEAGGKSYIMSRTFGSKEKDDEFILQDAETNLETADFSKNIGEELFQIDRASFSRSIYISQNDCRTAATDSINAKLGNLADSTDDLNNFESANKKITDKLNSLSKRRKTGILYKQKEQIADLKQKIKNGQSIDNSMDELLKLKNELNESYAELKDEQRILQEKQKAVSEYKDLEVKKNEYKHLCEDFEQKQEFFEEKAGFFPEKIPNSDEVEKCIKTASDDALLKKELDIYGMDENELSELNLLEGRFGTGVPDSENIGGKYQNIQIMQEISQKIEKSMLTEDEQREMGRLSDKFSQSVPMQEKLDYISRTWSIRTEKKNLLSSKKAAADMLARAGAGNETVENIAGNGMAADGFDNGKSGQTGSSGSKEAAGRQIKRNVLGILLMVLVIAASVTGIYLLTKSYLACVLCAVFQIAAIFISIKLFNRSKKIYSQENNSFIQNTQKNEASDLYSQRDSVDTADPYNDLRREISEDEDIIAKTDKEMENFLGQYKVLFDENNAAADLYQLREDLKSYKYLSEKSRQEDIELLQERYGQMEKDVKGFLDKYGFN